MEFKLTITFFDGEVSECPFEADSRDEAIDTAMDVEAEEALLVGKTVSSAVITDAAGAVIPWR